MSHQQGQDHPGNHGISCFTQGALLADWLPPLFALTQLGTGGKGGSGDPPQLPDGGQALLPGNRGSTSCARRGSGWENAFTGRLARLWKRLSRAVMESPPLGCSKKEEVRHFVMG